MPAPVSQRITSNAACRQISSNTKSPRLGLPPDKCDRQPPRFGIGDRRGNAGPSRMPCSVINRRLPEHDPFFPVDERSSYSEAGHDPNFKIVVMRCDSAWTGERENRLRHDVSRCPAPGWPHASAWRRIQLGTRQTSSEIVAEPDVSVPVLSNRIGGNFGQTLESPLHSGTALPGARRIQAHSRPPAVRPVPERTDRRSARPPDPPTARVRRDTRAQ